MFVTGILLIGGTIYVGKKVYVTGRKPKESLMELLTGSSPNKDHSNDAFLPSENEPEQAIEVLPAAETADALERRINQNLAISVVALGLATGGALVYAPLSLISIPVTLYTCIDIFQDAHHALFKERRVRVAFLDSIAVVSALAVRAFFASALASCFYFWGRKLLLKTEDSARKRLVEIFGERPRLVWRMVDGIEVETSFEDLCVGDIVVINAGGTIPIDGTITTGVASIDQRVLTGEAQPAEKVQGDLVFAATVVLAGRICIKVERTGVETVAAQIATILNQTANYESSIETKAQAYSDLSVLPTLGISALAFSTLGPMGAVTVVQSNFSEVLRVAGPLGMLNLLSIGSRSGLLIKDGRALELLHQVDTVVFDKTGTLTLEQPYVAAIYPLSELCEDELLIFAAAAEFRQTHPIAKAILQAAKERGLTLPNIDDAAYEVGYGIKVNLDKQVIRVGSRRFMETEGIAIPDEIRTQEEYAHEAGASFVYVAVNNFLGGAIELQPTIRPEAYKAVEQLKQRKVATVIISGDQEQPTRKLAQVLGIDQYFAEVLPEDKANLVERLQQEGRIVCFIGDGINDSIALKKANVSISFRGASAIATDTAQILLLDGTLNQLDSAFELAEQFANNLKGSLLTTFVPGLICIGGVFFFHFRIVSAIMLYNISLVAGVGNAMLPRLAQKYTNNDFIGLLFRRIQKNNYPELQGFLDSLEGFPVHFNFWKNLKTSQANSGSAIPTE